VQDEGRGWLRHWEDNEWHLVVLAPALHEAVCKEADPTRALGAALAHDGAEPGGVQPCLEDPVRVAAMEATHTGGRRGRSG
jgi:hypothetical protein